MLNNITIMGRLTKDPEMRTTTSGKFVTSFTLAVDRDFDRDKADFFACVAWNQTAEFVSKNFVKGQLVAVNGSMQSRTYTDKSNNKRTVWEVNASNVYFGEKKTSPFEELADEEEMPF